MSAADEGGEAGGEQAAMGGARTERGRQEGGDGEPELRTSRPLAVVGGGLLALVIGVAVAFQFDAVREAVDPQQLAQAVEPFRLSPLAGLVAVVGFALATGLGVPVSVCILATTVAFGPWLGVAYSFVAMMAAGAADFFAGRAIGRTTLRRYLGRRLDALDRRLANAPILALVILRFIPIAPYAVVNLGAGAVGVRFRDFMLSTGVASLPGVAALAVIGDRLRRVVEAPSASSLGLLLGALVVVAALGALAQYVIRRKGLAGEEDRSRDPGSA